MSEPLDFTPRPAFVSLPAYRPVVTYVLLGLIVLAFGAETLAGGSTQTDVLIKLGAKYSPLIASGEYWRLLHRHVPAHRLDAPCV